MTAVSTDERLPEVARAWNDPERSCSSFPGGHRCHSHAFTDPSPWVVACGALGAAAASRYAGPRPRTDSRTLLAVFAHPDDETSVGPLLARYAREGVTVYLAIATDGQKGVREHAGIPAGAELAAKRAGEARCACQALGIEPPILIGLEDGAMAQEENKAALVREVTRLFAELKPDAVITWGPDGLSGHTDHRIVSAIVTEVYQAAEDPPGQLYYVGFATESVARLAQTAGGPGAGDAPDDADGARALPPGPDRLRGAGRRGQRPLPRLPREPVHPRGDGGDRRAGRRSCRARR